MGKLTQQQLHELFDYEPDTGFFRWRKTRASNAIKGSVAGGLCTNGYRQIRVYGRFQLAHRMAWLYVHGVWPPETVDHINRMRDDNRIANLRLASISQNTFNQPNRKTEAINGVSWHKTARKWRAYITDMGKFRHLGCFSSYDDAVNARRAAEERLGVLR